MALRIRLRKQGRKNSPFYRLVLVDSKERRDGKYVEALGWYNPLEEGENNFSVEGARVNHWLGHGAELSEKAEALVARASPEVIKKFREHQLAQQDKRRQKRRAAKKAKA
ncbi:MAG: 30S ribosomal protein S16 [Chlamydiia bacterium]|nr:30S ribosomal protein S16 [Chlamydiia bacterium]